METAGNNAIDFEFGKKHSNLRIWRGYGRESDQRWSVTAFRILYVFYTLPKPTHDSRTAPHNSFPLTSPR
jgi:hypothetical protein